MQTRPKPNPTRLNPLIHNLIRGWFVTLPTWLGSRSRARKWRRKVKLRQTLIRWKSQILAVSFLRFLRLLSSSLFSLVLIFLWIWIWNGLGNSGQNSGGLNPSASLSALVSKRAKLQEELRHIEKQVYFPFHFRNLVMLSIYPCSNFCNFTSTHVVLLVQFSFIVFLRDMKWFVFSNCEIVYCHWTSSCTMKNHTF